MDPLIIHHVIRHPLSRIQTNNFQDKSGCSINGIRSFLFEQGMIEELDGAENIINDFLTIQDYRGYPIRLGIEDFDNFPLSDEILRMKNVQFVFEYDPNHKLVSPEPHFVEEERNLIENHLSYMGENCESEDIEEWGFFQMDYEGHLVKIMTPNFQLSNESIEHLSNFPCLNSLDMDIDLESKDEKNVTNLSLLSNLRNLSMRFEDEFEDQEFLKDLGLFSNLASLILRFKIKSGLNYLKTHFINLYFVESVMIPQSFSNLSNLAYLSMSKFTFQGFLLIS